jgi:hypothetical protein
MAYWTMASTLLWICTRDETALEELAEYASERHFSLIFLSCCEGMKLHIRQTETTPLYSTSPISLHFQDSPRVALDGLMAALCEGVLPVEGIRDNSRGYELIPALKGLRFRLSEGGNSGGEIGLPPDFLPSWSFLRLRDLNVKRLWPAPGLVGPKNEGTIITLLMQAAAGEQLKKEVAIGISHGHGVSRSAFERAWRNFPVERKVGRGKRGPSKESNYKTSAKEKG